MKIFDCPNKAGEPNGFEISNLFVSRGRACKIAASIPGVEIIRATRSWFAQDVFCIIRLGERVIEIEEPFGDNSRFYISANPPGWCPELAQVKEAFANEPLVSLPWSRGSRHAV